MSKFSKTLFLFLVLCISNIALANDNINSEEIKQKAIALYETGNYEESLKVFQSIPLKDKDENIYLFISNIASELGDDNLAIRNLNKALDKNYMFYKAYYNLGCILAKKKSYLMAAANFELAIKYNKNFDNAYYNLACCLIQQKNYEQAKKNLIKAIDLNPKNKDYYYNLAFCYKELNKPKQAQKILDVYNKMS